MDEPRPELEPLVIPLHAPKRLQRRLRLLSIVLPLAALAIFAAEPNGTNGTYAALAFGAVAVFWAVALVRRRRGARTPNRLIATQAQLIGPAFTLRWDRVARMRIGPLPGLAGGHPALWIEPLEPADIVWAETRSARLMARMSNTPSIRIPAANVDTPLEQLAAELEARAGRPLLAS